MARAQGESAPADTSKLPRLQPSGKRPWRSPRVIVSDLRRNTIKPTNTTNEYHKPTTTFYS